MIGIAPPGQETLNAPGFEEQEFPSTTTCYWCAQQPAAPPNQPSNRLHPIAIGTFDGQPICLQHAVTLANEPHMNLSTESGAPSTRSQLNRELW